MRKFVLIICLIHSFFSFSGPYGCVIFNELMVDPEPAVGLPEVEYIELFNRTSKPLSLKGWTLYYGEKSYAFPACMIDSAGYLVICSRSDYAVFASDLPVAVFESFPVLANTGKRIYLLNENGELVTSLEYRPEWYENDFKAKGGWSLECMDGHNLSGEASNWSSSVDLSGGTPGYLNSVATVNPDQSVPICTGVYVPSSTQIELTFSKCFQSDQPLSILHFEIQPQMAIVSSAFSDFPACRTVFLKLRDPLQSGTIYQLKLSALTDVSGLPVADTSVVFGLPEYPGPFDLSLNEVLFNPLPNGCDYVEFVNVSNKSVDLSQVWLTNKSESGTLREGIRLSERPRPCVPGSYWLLSVCGDSVFSVNGCSETSNKIDLTFFPSMPDASGQVMLLTTDAQVIDEMAYDEGMHFPLIGSKEGVALEKRNPQLNSSDQQSWRSASTNSGYGTPGFQNSQYADLSKMDAHGFAVQNKWMTPNNDGRDDVITVSYDVVEASIANLTIYDLDGRVVRNLAKNELLAATGSIFWDGLAEDGRLVSFGRYILHTDYFTPSGQRNKRRFVLTVLY
ncbi:MAG: lamin tail domain-containing protein [Bacteroidales bacterium]|nr:lamin tail domain-containing protein [Bacteroidales bacterium]